MLVVPACRSYQGSTVLIPGCKAPPSRQDRRNGQDFDSGNEKQHGTTKKTVLAERF